MKMRLRSTKISEKHNVLSNRFRVTYEYGWAESSTPNNAQAYDVIQTNAYDTASTADSWNVTVSFYSPALEVNE